MKNIKILSGFFMAISIIACKDAEDELLDINNTNEISVELIGTDLAVTEGAVNAIYAPMQGVGMNGRWGNLLYDAMSDEGNAPSDQADIDRISKYLLDGSTQANEQFFTGCYQGIHRCNTLLDEADKFSFAEDDNNNFLGQAYFMRAHYYFLLVTRFNEVPLKINAVDTQVPKSRAIDIYNQIISDLNNAADLLKEKGAQEQGRPTNESAYAYLGRVHMFKGDQFGDKEDYQLSLDNLNKVVSYSLVDSYIDNFHYNGEYNDESLFEIGFVDEAGTSSPDGAWQSGAPAGRGVIEGNFRSAEYSGWASIKATKTVFEAFESGDPRQEESFFENGDEMAGGVVTWGEGEGMTDDEKKEIEAKIGDGFNGWVNALPEDQYAVRKYSVYIDRKHQFQSNGINYKLIRYADVLLLKAEAEMKRDGGDLQTAVGYMNEVRARTSVNMPPYPTPEYPTGTFEEAFAALMHERQTELAFEGHRLVDLIRWKKDVETIIKVKSNYTAAKRYLPIPNKELQTNPNFNNTVGN